MKHIIDECPIVIGIHPLCFLPKKKSTEKLMSIFHDIKNALEIQEDYKLMLISSKGIKRATKDMLKIGEIGYCDSKNKIICVAETDDKDYYKTMTRLLIHELAHVRLGKHPWRIVNR